MKTEIKSLVVEKMDDEGHGLARIATLAAVDHDGDTYADGAFDWKEGGQWVPILPAHDRRAMPLGKARIYEDGGFAYAELHLNLQTSAGQDWHKHLKFDLAKGRPAQEWSYGFGVMDAVNEHRNGERVRVLKRLDVHEVSPVVRGAGAGTGTLAMKSRGSFADHVDAMIEELDDLVTRAEGVKSTRANDGRKLGADRREQLKQLKTRLVAVLDLDETGEDEGKALVEAEAQAQGERLAATFETRAASRRWASSQN
ncbi:MAG: HK97 family phage prohead protease [Pseudomonadota bacterium]|nr:HK97 family phage prohead protease [Pseudomonadota bacterium]